jgi:hypothetical protein
LNSASEIERTNVLKKKLTDWEFDSHKLSDDDLMRCVVIIFEHAMELDELRELKISTGKNLKLFIFFFFLEKKKK